MKTITINDRSKCKTLHIEAPGCIINIRVGLADHAGNAVTAISVSANGDRYAGEPEWWAETDDGLSDGYAMRVIQRQRP